MRKALLLLLALGLFPTLVFAQAETTGRVAGTVTTEDKAPIAGAEIEVDSPSLAGTRKTTTDANGKYLVGLLPGGLYTATVSAPNMGPREFKFRVGVNQVVPLDVVLRPGEALEEVVDVYAPAVKMETTAGGENFNYRNQIDLLPVTNRDINFVANLAPNVSFGPTQGTTNNTISISGAPSFDNAVLLDGSDISDPFYSGGVTVYLEEAIEEVQVMTNGISARYGRFQGGVINATTKSGGNTFDGTVRADISKESWNSKTPFPGEQQATTYDKVYSATFGGPIVKDHLWFFVGGRTIPSQADAHSQLVIPGNFTTQTNQDRGQIKLTGSINANHTVEASFLKYDRTQKNYDPFFWVAERNAIIGQRKDPYKNYTLDYRGVLSDRTFLDATIAKKDVSIISGGDPSKPSPILEFFDGQYQAYANGWFDPSDPSERNSESAAISLTHTLSSANWGAHTIEYGLQYVDSITAGDNRQSATGYNLYLNTPVNTLASFATCDPLTGDCVFDLDEDLWFNERLKAIPGAGEQDMKNYALYAQDSWEIEKFRIDVGARYEQWKGQAVSPAMTLDFKAFSPRVGVTYNVTHDWQIQGSWGKYVSRFNDSVANGISGISSLFGPGILQEYSGPDVFDQTPAQIDAILRDDSNWGAILAYVNPLQPTNFFAEGVTAPYADDFNLSVKRALPRNQGLVELRYTRRSFEDLLDNYVGGLGVTTVTLPDSTTADVDTLVWDNCGACQRDYESITANWEYRPGNVWDFGGNYTYSTTQGNYEGEANGQPAIGSIIGNYPNNVVASLAYPYGYLLSDVRHKLRGWGNYRIDFSRAGKLTLGGILSYRSGSAYSLTGRFPTGSDPAPDYSGSPSSFTAFSDGRGNQRFNGFWSLDTSFRYDAKFWKDLGAYIKLSVLNITNNDELFTFRTGGQIVAGPGGVPTFQPNANFGTASSENSYQIPRSYFLTVGLFW